MSAPLATGGFECTNSGSALSTEGYECLAGGELIQKRRTIVVAKNVGGGKHPGGIVVAGEVE